MECWISFLERSFTTSDLELIQMNLRGDLSSTVVCVVTSTNLIKNTFHILRKLRSLKNLWHQNYTNYFRRSAGGSYWPGECREHRGDTPVWSWCVGTLPCWRRRADSESTRSCSWRRSFSTSWQRPGRPPWPGWRRGWRGWAEVCVVTLPSLDWPALRPERERRPPQWLGSCLYVNWIQIVSRLPLSRYY